MAERSAMQTSESATGRVPRRTKVGYARFMAGSRCRVSFTDGEGVLHGVDVDDGSLYEAVAIAVAQFRERIGFISSVVNADPLPKEQVAPLIIAMESCDATSPHCGRLNHISGFTEVFAFRCQYCGEGVGG